LKGILLAGGLGTRLYPLTKITNKHLLPVYDRPMIHFPLMNLISSGIDDIMVVTGPEYSGRFASLLTNGSDYGIDLSFKVQKEPLGIAHGIKLCETWAGKDDIMVVLGDNITFEKFGGDCIDLIRRGGAKIFIKTVPNPERFGVVTLYDDGRIVDIEEKPEKPKSNTIQIGVYMFDSGIWSLLSKLKMSRRGQLEITDITNHYLSMEALDYRMIESPWFDAGNIESLFEASEYVRKKRQEEKEHDPRRKGLQKNGSSIHDDD